MTESLRGVQKSAILLLSLSEQQAEEILDRMPADAADVVRREMVALREIPDGARREVLQQYQDEIFQEAAAPSGSRQMSEQGTFPLAAATVEDLTELLYDEHPQLICAVLSMLSADRSGACISGFSVQKQIDVFCRMASLRPLDPEIRERLIQLVEQRVSHRPRVAQPAVDVALLSRVLDDATESDSHDDAQPAEPAPANFSFDDLLKLSDEALRGLLDEVEQGELAMSLRVASKQVRRRILGALPGETAREVRQSSDGLGPIHLGDAEAAQGRILRVLHRLEAAGEVTLSAEGNQSCR